MQVFLVIKCGLVDAHNFIIQLTSIHSVEKVTVFRDSPSLPDNKVNYILPQCENMTILKLINRLLQIIKRRHLKPKLIIGIYEIPHGLLAMLAGKILKVPSVVSIIGNPAFAKLRKGFRMKVTMWILKNCDYITVTGINSRNFLAEKGISPEKLFILPNTLDFTAFNSSGIDKEYDIVSLGRLSEEKHVEVIVTLISYLKRTIPNIKAAIGGDGPQKEMIIELITKLDLKENIDVMGFVPDEELKGFFNKGKVFVLTSETEGFPRTIIQAAACGIPVVASAVGDVPEIIDHQIDGFLVEDFSNVEEYAQRVLQLLNDEKLYSKFSVNLNQKVRKQFVTEKATIVWQEIVNKIG
jgi:glycosyltransferase involved in cell wall biosynthesis